MPEVPQVQVRMGFGLHVGWAIEGAIGSEYKIDASYLSPNVNMASRLEAATKQFGTSILMSEDFARLLSPQVPKLPTSLLPPSRHICFDTCGFQPGSTCMTPACEMLTLLNTMLNTTCSADTPEGETVV